MVEVGWNLDPPPGFQGLHPDKPVTIYHRHLPHWRQDGATYFLTFRQHDSLPANKLHELEGLRADWERRNPHPRSNKQWEELIENTNRRIEVWLDQGLGSCQLADERAAHEVANAMHYFDGDRYELGCYVIMPNHVHAIVRPLAAEQQPLEKILHSWKRHSAREINRLLNRTGAFWQNETFDRIIRDAEHLYRCIQYIGRNPKSAGKRHRRCPLWIREAWKQLGWCFAEPLSPGEV